MYLQQVMQKAAHHASVKRDSSLDTILFADQGLLNSISSQCEFNNWTE
jgi:hypothetical protein